MRKIFAVVLITIISFHLYSFGITPARRNFRAKVCDSVMMSSSISALDLIDIDDDGIIEVYLRVRKGNTNINWLSLDPDELVLTETRYVEANPDGTLGRYTFNYFVDASQLPIGPIIEGGIEIFQENSSQAQSGYISQVTMTIDANNCNLNASSYCGTSEVFLEWSPNILPVNSYSIVRSIDNIVTNANIDEGETIAEDLGSNILSYTDNIGIANQNYCYTVFGYHSDGRVILVSSPQFVDKSNVPPFETISPNYDSMITSLRPTFTWEKPSDEFSGFYNLYISQSEDFINPVIIENISDNIFTLDFNLEANTSYCWKVTANNNLCETQSNSRLNITQENNTVTGSERDPAHPNEDAIDNNFLSYWKYLAPDTYDYTQYITIDFFNTYKINRIKISTSSNKILSGKLYVNEPANNDFIPFYVHSCDETGTVFNDISITPREMDGLKLVILRNSVYGWGYVYEIEIFQAHSTFLTGSTTSEEIITINENDLNEISFEDVNTTIQFTENHLATELTITKTLDSPNIVGLLPTGIESIASSYWTILSIAGNVGNYEVTFDLSGVAGIDDFSTLSFLKRDDDTSSWVNVENIPGVTVLRNAPLFKIIGLTNFSDFVPASGNDNTLPVTLSSFTAAYINSASTLSWTTQSESNNLGWNVYKSQTENATNAMIVNAELIPGAGVTTEPTYYSFIDDIDLADNVTYYYWIEDVTYDNTSNLHGPVSITVTEEEEDPNTPEFALKTQIHNYPNPFNPNTQIHFLLKESEVAEKIEIFNAKGQKIYNADDPISPHSWNGKDTSGSDVASGIYLYKITTNNKNYLKKMVLSK